MNLPASQQGSGPLRVGLLSVWASRLGGGVFEAVVALGEAIRAQGHEPLLFALRDGCSDADRVRFPGEVHLFDVSGPRAIGYAPKLRAALLAANLDVLHQHGIWMYPTRAGGDWAQATGRPYFVSPHGMLDPWILSRGKWKKALARAGYERRSWRLAHALHALTEAEAQDIRRETGRDRIEVVPNAIGGTASPPDAADPYILSLGRIHPKKNLFGLIDGWRQSPGPAAGWRLVIAGWGEAADVAAFEARLAELADPSIAFVGPAYGEDKARLMGGARFLALPSFSEGLPLAILEAWAAGTPTIQSQGCNLAIGIEGGAAIETGTGAAQIAAAIKQAVELDPPAYTRMMDAAAGIAAKHFSPTAIGARWAAIYADAVAREGRR